MKLHDEGRSKKERGGKDGGVRRRGGGTRREKEEKQNEKKKEEPGWQVKTRTPLRMWGNRNKSTNK